MMKSKLEKDLIRSMYSLFLRDFEEAGVSKFHNVSNCFLWHESENRRTFIVTWY